MEKTVGERIALKRKEAGLSQNKLAEILFVSNKAVSKWESDLSRPSFDLLPKLADTLNCSIDYIVRGEKDEFEKLKAQINQLLEQDKIGVALVQRTFTMGYAKASRLVDLLIDKGFIESYKNPKILSNKTKEDMFNTIYNYIISNLNSLSISDFINFEKSLKLLLKGKLTAIAYDVWIESLTFNRVYDGVLYIEVPSVSSKNVVEKNYSKMILKFAKELNPNIEKIEIQVSSKID